MTNNEILRKLCEIFEFESTELINIFGKAGHSPTREYVNGLTAKKSRPNFQTCSNEDLIAFLNGFIHVKRGPSPDSSTPNNITYNLILKKVRVALKLHEKDMLTIFTEGGIEISKNDLSTLFRNEQHKHYRECTDKQFRGFLLGLKKYSSQKG